MQRITKPSKPIPTNLILVRTPMNDERIDQFISTLNRFLSSDRETYTIAYGVDETVTFTRDELYVVITALRMSQGRHL